MSWDIGEKNFAWAKTNVNQDELAKLRAGNIPPKQRYDANGECLPEMSKLLTSMHMLGEQVGMGKCDLTQLDDKKFKKRRVITNGILVRLTNYLEDLNKAGVYDDVNYFLIEEQRTIATNNQQLQYHLRGYLIQLFLTFRPIVMFPSKYKTVILGAPKKIWNERKSKLAKLTYTQRKKWAGQKALQILTIRKDNDSIDSIFTKKKYGPVADVSDCMLMNECFLYLLFVDDRREILDC